MSFVRAGGVVRVDRPSLRVGFKYQSKRSGVSNLIFFGSSELDNKGASEWVG